MIELDGSRRWLLSKDVSPAKTKTSRQEKRSSRLRSRIDKIQSSRRSRHVKVLLCTATSSSKSRALSHHPAKRLPRSSSQTPSKTTTDRILIKS